MFGNANVGEWGRPGDHYLAFFATQWCISRVLLLSVSGICGGVGGGGIQKL